MPLLGLSKPKFAPDKLDVSDRIRTENWPDSINEVINGGFSLSKFDNPYLIDEFHLLLSISIVPHHDTTTQSWSDSKNFDWSNSLNNEGMVVGDLRIHDRQQMT